MLKQLTIKNYALIQHLEMEPAAGLNVITGETGAGKSIMLGAVGLLLGNRADTKVLWDESEKCVTEAEFDLASYKLQKLFKTEDLDYETRTVIRREISANGKSRAFINDTPVTLEVLRRITSRLMDVHSQHETLELGSRSFQLKLIDAYAGNQKILEQYESQWIAFTTTKQEYEVLLAESTALKQEADYVKFQLDELVKASFVETEQEKLESEMKVQENAEEIKSKLNFSIQALGTSEYSVSTMLGEVRNHLNAISSFASSYQTLFKRIESLKIELDDILKEVESEEGNVEFNETRREEVSQRLSALYHLFKKHRVNNVTELLKIQEDLEMRSQKVNNLDSMLASLKQKTSQAGEDLDLKADGLSKARQKAFGPLARQMTSLLKELGIPDAKVKIDAETVAAGSTGKDNVEVFFSANKGIDVRPLAQVASGGEFSRLMFCLKYIMAEKTAMPTLVLDEIDTGVSGEIAISLGKLMKEMAQSHQVISISHLPQIAAQGDAHYYVFKNSTSKKTVSSIKKLNESERVEEIAKMIGGAKPSASAIQNAKELIART
ncbi:MAG TPA: DNA repair protein RecN [Cyclobacteriaceae bacterium]|nr:DNA repair protein RecN [Cyclobacteriaceae bacterium]